MVMTLKQVSFTAEEKVIAAAAELAKSQDMTLDDLLQKWLEEYTERELRMARYEAAVAGIRGKIAVTRKLTRDKMNAR